MTAAEKQAPRVLKQNDADCETGWQPMGRSECEAGPTVEGKKYAYAGDHGLGEGEAAGECRHAWWPKQGCFVWKGEAYFSTCQDKMKWQSTSGRRGICVPSSGDQHHDGGGVRRVKLRGKSGTERVRIKCKQGQGAEKKYTLSKTAKYYDHFVGAGEEFTIEYTNDNFTANDKGEQADVFVTDQYDNREDNDRHKQPFLIKSEDTSFPSCPEYNTSRDRHAGRCGVMQDGVLAWLKVYTLKVKVRETERHHDGGGVRRVKLRGKSGTEKVRIKCKGTVEVHTLSKTAKYYDLPCDFVGAGEEFTIEFINDHNVADGRTTDVYVTDQYDNRDHRDKQPFLIKSEGSFCPEYTSSRALKDGRCGTMHDGLLAWWYVYTLQVRETA
eukprot:g14179.t1